DEDGRLADVGGVEPLGRSVRTGRQQVKPEGGGRLVEQVFRGRQRRGKCCAHADVLRPLAGEEEGGLHQQKDAGCRIDPNPFVILASRIPHPSASDIFGSDSSSWTIFSLSFTRAFFAATPIAFRMATSLLDPWQMMQIPSTPRSGAPPNVL